VSACRALVVACALTGLPACASYSAQDSVDAVLVKPDPAVRAALSNAIKEALNGRDPTLSDDALTASSHLMIEPARPRDSNGRLLDGRDLRKPESFHLMKQGEDCVLIHDRTKKEFVLPGAQCAEEKARGEDNHKDHKEHKDQ
jgi:hypothetical protein